MGYPTEGKGYINASHTEMCRFGHRTNPDYVLVLDVLRRFVHDANVPVDGYLGSEKCRTCGSKPKKREPHHVAQAIKSPEGEDSFQGAKSDAIELTELVRKEK
jgi:hypothetical protein